MYGFVDRLRHKRLAVDKLRLIGIHKSIVRSNLVRRNRGHCLLMRWNMAGSGLTAFCGQSKYEALVVHILSGRKSEY